MDITTNTHWQQSSGLTSREPYRSAYNRTQILTIFFFLYVAADLLAVISNLLHLNMLGSKAAGVQVPEEAAALTALGQVAGNGLCALALLATSVAFLFWVHRAYANLAALGNQPGTLDYSPRWAVGSFFIPIANLFMPYAIVREIWQKSDPAVRTEDDFLHSVPGSSPLLLWWWLSWIAMTVVSRLANFFWRGDSISVLQTRSKALLLSNILGLVAAVLALLVVRSIYRRQEERSRNVTFAPPTPPAPAFFPPPMPLPPQP